MNMSYIKSGRRQREQKKKRTPSVCQDDKSPPPPHLLHRCLLFILDGFESHNGGIWPSPSRSLPHASTHHTQRRLGRKMDVTQRTHVGFVAIIFLSFYCHRVLPSRLVERFCDSNKSQKTCTRRAHKRIEEMTHIMSTRVPRVIRRRSWRAQ